jgi:hypothetical protein
MLERLASDKRLGLLVPIVSYKVKGFVKTAKGQYSKQFIFYLTFK